MPIGTAENDEDFSIAVLNSGDVIVANSKAGVVILPNQGTASPRQIIPALSRRPAAQPGTNR